MLSFVESVIISSPTLRKIADSILRPIKKSKFQGSEAYWEKRYSQGGNSGSGSYNRLAEFKAKVINDFLITHNIKTALEFGCGDGNNLSLINYPNYIGLDVSPSAIKLCIDKFSSDDTKSFYLYSSIAFQDQKRLFNADVTLSLDVIYHLIEDHIFHLYMTHLFQTSNRFVIIYSRDFDDNGTVHEKNRKFSDWISSHQPNIKLIKFIQNPYPFDPHNPDLTSDANFYIYEKY